MSVSEQADAPAVIRSGTGDGASARRPARQPEGALAGETPVPVLRLGAFEGPLDLLLALARAQRVDLARISILAVVEQFLAAVEGARALRLELAADWLVMAAWLAWLKSRLLLPADATEEDARDAAGLLAARIAGLEEVRAAAGWLGARPQLGVDVFGRGAPERLVREDRSRLSADLPGLVQAYLGGVRRAGARETYRPRPPALPGLAEALVRLSRLLGGLPGWTELRHFLPGEAAGDADAALRRRAGVASTLLAGLELAREGAVLLRQDDAFGPILLRRVDALAMAAE